MVVRVYTGKPHHRPHTGVVYAHTGSVPSPRQHNHTRNHTTKWLPTRSSPLEYNTTLVCGHEARTHNPERLMGTEPENTTYEHANLSTQLPIPDGANPSLAHQDPSCTGLPAGIPVTKGIFASISKMFWRVSQHRKSKSPIATRRTRPRNACALIHSTPRGRASRVEVPTHRATSSLNYRTVTQRFYTWAQHANGAQTKQRQLTATYPCEHALSGGPPQTRPSQA